MFCNIKKGEIQMKKHNNPSKELDFLTVLFNGMAEVGKILISIIMAIVVAGSKTSCRSAEDKTLHAGDRHNNDKSVHFDNDA